MKYNSSYYIGNKFCFKRRISVSQVHFLYVFRILHPVVSYRMSRDIMLTFTHCRFVTM